MVNTSMVKEQIIQKLPGRFCNRKSPPAHDEFQGESDVCLGLIVFQALKNSEILVVIGANKCLDEISIFSTKVWRFWVYFNNMEI